MTRIEPMGEEEIRIDMRQGDLIQFIAEIRYELRVAKKSNVRKLLIEMAFLIHRISHPFSQNVDEADRVNGSSN